VQPAVTVAIDLSAQGLMAARAASITWIKWLGDEDGVRNITGQLVETPRDSFMEAAEKELIAFERKEREFRRKEKQGRAEQLQMLALKPLHS
jgi:hypothetical protein